MKPCQEKGSAASSDLFRSIHGTHRWGGGKSFGYINKRFEKSIWPCYYFFNFVLFCFVMASFTNILFCFVLLMTPYKTLFVTNVLLTRTSLLSAYPSLPSPLKNKVDEVDVVE